MSGEKWRGELQSGVASGVWGVEVKGGRMWGVVCGDEKWCEEYVSYMYIFHKY